MHRARAFFFVCAGIFLLALSYHFGARSAGAQVGSQIVGYIAYGNGWHYVMTSNGDAYVQSTGTWNNPFSSSPPTYLGNFWGGATPAQSISIGQLKAKYAK